MLWEVELHDDCQLHCVVQGVKVMVYSSCNFFARALNSFAFFSSLVTPSPKWYIRLAFAHPQGCPNLQLFTEYSIAFFMSFLTVPFPCKYNPLRLKQPFFNPPSHDFWKYFRAWLGSVGYLFCKTRPALLQLPIDPSLHAPSYNSRALSAFLETPETE